MWLQIRKSNHFLILNKRRAMIENMQYNVQYTLINRDPDHSESKSSYTYLYFLCSPRQLIKKICVRAFTLWK